MVNGVGNQYNYVDNTLYGQTTKKAEETKAAEGTAAEATANEKAAEETAASTTQKAETYKPDLEKINQMKADLKNNLAAFSKMVYSEIKTQGNSADDTLKALLNGVLGMTQEEAQASISDDGDWGVDATANRILDFAVALSGGDPEKIELLRNAVQKGFDAAGSVWGGDLPQISHDTLAKIMEGFDEWAESGSAANIGSNKKAAEGTTAVTEE
jgi:translation initiation factor 1 (eIF-1/SUI1)